MRGAKHLCSMTEVRTRGIPRWHFRSEIYRGGVSLASMEVDSPDRPRARLSRLSHAWPSQEPASKWHAESASLTGPCQPCRCTAPIGEAAADHWSGWQLLPHGGQVLLRGPWPAVRAQEQVPPVVAVHAPLDRARELLCGREVATACQCCTWTGPGPRTHPWGPRNN